MRTRVLKEGGTIRQKVRWKKGKRGMGEHEKKGRKNLKKSVDKGAGKCYYTQAVTNERGKTQESDEHKDRLRSLKRKELRKKRRRKSTLKTV